VVARVVVLQVIARMNLGGASKYIIQLSKELEAIGINSPIATGYVQKGEIEDPDLKKLHPIRIKHLGRKISPKNDLKSMIELSKLIFEIKPDIVHTHTFKAGFIARIQRNIIEKKLGKKIKFIHTIHGHLFDDPEFKGIKSLVIALIERHLANRTDQLITNGITVAKDLKRKGINEYKDITSIYPGVVPIKLISKVSSLKRFQIHDKQRVRVLWMARVTGVKNPKKLISIARALPEIDFYMAGSGDLLEEIKAIVPINLKVLDWQEAKNVLPIADIFLSTSENEGVPMALVEAQLAGIPIVATNVGSVSEVVINNKTGLLCDKSEKQLILSIKKIAENKKLRSTFSKQAKILALKKFSTTKFINAHRNIYFKT
jgi:glycosyltransferase involved in cell wall biosynthesis